MDGGVGFDEPELSWSTQDIENKIGFSGGRYTDTNAFFTGKNMKEVSQVLNKELQTLSIWFKVNKLSLNVEKTNL